MPANCKGFRVITEKSGKKRLERIAFYGRDASAKIRGRNSKKVTVVQPQLGQLFGKGRPG